MEVTTIQKPEISLTPKAVEKVLEIMKQQPEPYEALRVRVVGGGCSGYQYQMYFEKEPAVDDVKLEFGDLKVFVDERSLLYIKGTEIDYVEAISGTGFKFSNPNVTGSCGCGESFNV